MVYESKLRMDYGVKSHVLLHLPDQARCISVKSALPSNAEFLCFLCSYIITLTFTHITSFLLLAFFQSMIRTSDLISIRSIAWTRSSGFQPLQVLLFFPSPQNAQTDNSSRSRHHYLPSPTFRMMRLSCIREAIRMFKAKSHNSTA